MPVEHTLAIVGGGQLARMLAMAAHRLGVRTRCLAPSPDACAGDVAELIVAPYDDHQALTRLVQGCTAVTCEFESVPAASLAFVAEQLPCRPGPASFEATQDRLNERQLLDGLGIAVAPYRAVASTDDLEQGLSQLGTPAVLKARTLGYDGKGQARIERPADTSDGWQRIGQRPAIVEQRIDFDLEFSIAVARHPDGQLRTYPASRNEHRGGILRVSHCPAGIPASIEEAAGDCVRRIADALDHVGVITVEFFLVGDSFLVNEIAPRVHNSFHWTIEGTRTSQFDNHVRAVLGLPLGSPALAVSAVRMHNFIGAHPPLEALLEIDGLSLHLYRKAGRPGRKIGHATLTGDAARIAAAAAAVDDLTQ